MASHSCTSTTQRWATLTAVEADVTGVYNIADGCPRRLADWVPGLAEAVGAKPPRSVPTFIARVVRGELGASLMTRVRGIANGKATRELGWQPRYPSYRESFRAGMPELPAVRRAARN